MAEWLALAGDVAATYVSSRRGDHPAHYQRVVVITKPNEGPSHLIQAASGRDIWIVFTLDRRTGIQRFHSLRSALNAVRPVFKDEAASRSDA